MTSDLILLCSAIWNGCRCGRPPHKDKDDRHVWMNTLDNGRAVDPALYPSALSTTPAHPMSDPLREALEAVYDLGDQLDSNHTRWAAYQIAERLGVTLRVHNDFSEPPRNRNEEQIAALQARIDELESAALPRPICLNVDEAAVIVEALTIGRISYDGDSWFAANEGYGYDEAEATLNKASAILRTWPIGAPHE